MVDSEIIHKPPLQIVPDSYFGKDLRELPEEEVEMIITQYGTLRNNPDGYRLGQTIMALKQVRNIVKEIPAIQEMLDDSSNWIFTKPEPT
ncbi:MAG: hypothetical protein US95_C0028G0003 [Candidatus Woesebacteria bacterium GW2011_GWB1_38_5]|uniref:Uncharacterized protein n=3 Tax=Candidatus Woeseibacteriota TaxID=1752722 RepID=A0A0G0NB27_9BACT|nr:MAG: hypothetical protein US67_C0037G0012 [Candidatus Woesebacteria bacterium GW2011_GWD1_38_10]KKQ56735.1 MAG: hypothetical protein US75_C0003G0022 [Candidatus Woesebacteria bacterium GW2011_GWC1_38_13]KKQ74316.1 MAG: hypothetical protein US95_C0028G0003 [Candidatus Woesebacteria bacterium GW2011_GWB1_38_5]KKQ75274.1 MAG: hypothetical protein US97_C0043G0003 [Microgenomates group bacterium GW2011_GWF1_38_5]